MGTRKKGQGAPSHRGVWGNRHGLRRPLSAQASSGHPSFSCLTPPILSPSFFLHSSLSLSCLCLLLPGFLSPFWCHLSLGFCVSHLPLVLLPLSFSASSPSSGFDREAHSIPHPRAGWGLWGASTDYAENVCLDQSNSCVWGALCSDFSLVMSETEESALRVHTPEISTARGQDCSVGNPLPCSVPLFHS